MKAKKEDKEEKTFKITVRFTKSERDNLEKKASLVTDGDLSKLIRIFVSKNKVEIVSKVDLDTKNQLRKIGVNINQVVHKINQESNKNILKYEFIELQKFINEIREMIKKIG